MTDVAEVAIRRAARAAELLDPDGLLMECFASARAEFAEAWRTSPARDTEGREALYALARATDRIESILRGFVEDGTIARHRIAAAERDRTMTDALAAAAGIG